MLLGTFALRSKAATPIPDAESRKTLVLMFHDESIFNTNEGQTWMWAAEGQPIIQSKTRGSGIMVSDFIDEHSGYLKLSDDEHSLAKASDPEFPNVLQQWTTIIECSFSSM